MYFDSVKEIREIAGRSGCSVFVVPDSVGIDLPGALVLKPEDKSTITIDQVREVIGVLAVKQTNEQFVVVRPANAMGEEAANAFLKNLEEPGDKIHFVLITEALSRLLPTILSRAAVYFLRSDEPVDGPIHADAKVQAMAKRFIVAKPGDLVGLAEEVCKKKDGVRAYAQEVLAVTIEMLYKSYLKTGKDAFLARVPKFLAAYEAISKNGHVKLHLVADLV